MAERTISIAASPDDYLEAKELFLEYAGSLDFSLGFQRFDDELEILPQTYGAPTGCLLLVRDGGQAIGAAGLRRIENDTTCEIKRMYLRPTYRGEGLGKLLMERLLAEAKQLGYRLIKLDTIGEKMPSAVRLYRSAGFREVAPYNFNPYEGVLYFEKELEVPETE